MILNDLKLPLVVTAIVLLIVWLLWWWLPKWQASRPPPDQTRADREDNFRKIVGQALGGAAVLLGTAFTVYQFWYQRHEAQEQQQTAQTQFRQQQKAAHDLLISNQVSKGFEQLASDAMEMRLGGIYALEGVMNTSEQYHRAVLETLCAFVRERPAKIVNDPAPHEAPIKPATDVQAALTVIGRREIQETDRVDLSHANISSVDLIDANLTKANLSGANLSGVNLNYANLSGANLSSANLIGANLSSANLIGANLIGANLSGGALLTSAYLRDALLTGADLSGALLIDADLTGANLSGSKNLNQKQLDQACGNADTKLPEGLTLKACKKK